MELSQYLWNKIWSPYIWLPSNVTWDDIAPGARPNVNYPDSTDILWSLPLAVVIFAVRWCFETYFSSVIGRSYGIENNWKVVPKNAVLESAYYRGRHLGQHRVRDLIKQTDLTERQIQQWWRLRRAKDKPSLLDKFNESCWRVFYYTSSFGYGLVVLWNKPWLWNVSECWTNYPYQSVENDIWWYYMISLGFYISVMVTHFFDVKRKDFWQMFVHHIATNLLLWLSWTSRLQRIGTLILVSHDLADAVLQVAKVVKYMKLDKCADRVFIMFSISWIGSRLVYFPRIIYNTTFEDIQFEKSIVHIVLVVLMYILLGLHIMWTYFLVQMVRQMVKDGQVEKDIRSDSSDDSGNEITDPSSINGVNYSIKRKLVSDCNS